MNVGVLATLFLLLGCGTSKRTGTSTAPATGSAAPAEMSDVRGACAAALGKAARTGRGGEQFSAEDQKFGTAIETVMTESCAATKWSENVLLCLTNGTTREELGGCTEMLTAEQRQDMQERVLVLTKEHEGAPNPAAKPVP